MTNQTIEQAVEEFKKQFNAYQTTSSSPYPLLVDWLRQALQAQRDAGAKEERDKWVKAVGEKIDKNTRELMMSSFNEGVAVTRAQYDEAIKNLTPPTK